MSPRYLGWWVLDANGLPWPEPDAAAAFRWRAEHPELWKIAADKLPRWWVSTVFLPLDHQFGAGPPLLFETMVFRPGSFRDHYCERYSTKSEALAGHARIVQALVAGTLGLEDEETDDIPAAFRQAFRDDQEEEDRSAGHHP